ncbi:MAG: adenosyl-hopene transferase HpnH [Dehalococcoidales bacterium]|jgi:hopanoid biosynthesis associated radical SAM protein HpnH|nr:adenosyl-hopene transferase HpnH [Dehalococcoidales bacterium]
MGFPRELSVALSGYLLKNKLLGKKRFPLVLMLEPLFRCNLHCAGCGRIREYHDVLDKTLSLEECLTSVQEADAPVVSITGGEPLLHPDIDQIVKRIIQQKRFVNLCTNGLLLENSLDRFKPDPHFFLVLHLDGMAETHDKIAGRKGVFERAISAIRFARKRGFQVLINTTIYRQSSVEEIRELFILLAGIPVTGIMVAPAFSYEAVKEDCFLSRREMTQAFLPVYEMRKEVPFFNTPLYLEFLAGRLDLQCTPWSTPTRNPKGWKMPCYLITDGHFPTYKDLMERTDWSKYGVGNDPRCANCMVHCGFEASALSAMKASLPNLWKTIRGIYFK